jgi:hypothetical protein
VRVVGAGSLSIWPIFVDIWGADGNAIYWVLGCENFILGFGCGIWKGGKNGPLLWAHEPNPLRWLVQTDLRADKVVLRSLLLALPHAGVKPNPYPRRSPETTQWQRATCALMTFSLLSKDWDPRVSSHMWRQGSLYSLGTFWGNFNDGPSHRPFWVIIEKSQVTISSFFFFSKGGGHVWFSIVLRHCLLKINLYCCENL